MHLTLAEFLGRLEGVTGGGGQYSAKCPNHGDQHNSLSISAGQDGRVLLHCHAGCSTEDIVWSMGLQMKDLFVETTPGEAFPVYSAPKGNRPTAKFEAEYIYHGGDLKKVKMRQTDGGKYFAWRHLRDGQWAKGRNGIEPGLYTSTGGGARPSAVFLGEGEKDVDTLKGLGMAAVSLPDGAKSKWRTEYGRALEGREVVLIQDNDDAGKAFAQMVAGELRGRASSIKVLDLSACWPDIPEHGDFTDLVTRFGPGSALRAVQTLAQDAPEWTPPPAEEDPLLSLFKPLEGFPEEEAKWLVPGWIPEAQITLIAADGGIGKTTLWCHIIAALSSGTSCILDPPGFTRPPMKVTFLTTEDSVRKKLRKKLRLAGANMQNIITPDFVGDTSGLLHKLKFGTPEMGKVLRYFRPVLCIFDPVQGFTPPSVNMGSRNEMRDCMAPLISIGEEINTTSLIICHTNKRKGAYGRDRIADSADLWDISRSVMMAGFTEDPGVRYLSNEKNNYAQLQETVLFTIDENGQIQRAGTSWKRDREYIQGAELAKSAPKREDCKAFLLKTLNEAGGAMPTNDLEAKATQAGYSFSAVKRAKKDLKAEGKTRYFQTGSTRTKDNIWHIQAITTDLDHDFVELPEDTPTPFDESIGQRATSGPE